jgi:hypothetical protein
MGEELRAGGRSAAQSASDGARRDEPEFGVGRVTGISLPGYCPNEAHWPPLSRHLLVLMTKPPATMRLRYEGVKRDLPSPAGSIAVLPVGSVVESSWQGTADWLRLYLDPKLTARVATTSFELDVSHTAIPPLDALILPELRSTMLAVDAELTTVLFLGRDRWRHTGAVRASAKIAKNRSEQVPPRHRAENLLSLLLK